MLEARLRVSLSQYVFSEDLCHGSSRMTPSSPALNSPGQLMRDATGHDGKKKQEGKLQMKKEEKSNIKEKAAYAHYGVGFEEGDGNGLLQTFDLRVYRAILR